MSTNLEYRAREIQRKREKLNEKKGDRDREGEIKNKGDIFLLEEQHENFDKMRNASSHQCKKKKMSSVKKMRTRTRTTFPA